MHHATANVSCSWKNILFQIVDFYGVYHWFTIFQAFLLFDFNYIGGLQVSVLILSVVDRGLETWSSQTKD